ncbi:X-Pro dipeptidyl-peptidase [Runella rosea]|uniref:X-Pro dipeptidyl-peptidase n=1 Tax=Runella rosea TaxID=2259595 RepID=A0A344TDB7_9BACT|nr:CocE/NonD family hydrolase [Runella rosea]AXE16638.1 X-Pro dipeptidyl-peptidase [Runella rosea]
MKAFLPLLILLFCAHQSHAQTPNFVKDNYEKWDRQITMRDGIKLYTIIYIPKDKSQNYPILIERTPYSAGPYGEGNYTGNGPGPSKLLSEEKYIFVTQDVRGRYMSEGKFEEMTPHKFTKKTPQDTDESTDTYDTVEWLLKNIPQNNGRVGITGISYPGFYASAALPDAHPAIKAVSPQAPVTDEFVGDDARHNGAFFLLDNFNFLSYFDAQPDKPVPTYNGIFNNRSKDAYDFFLKLGPLKNANGEKYFNNKGRIWNEYLQHETYDDYWKSRNIRPALKNIKPATLVVGGWFDAEDLFGALRTYEAIEKQTPTNKNQLVMGPWTHGAWSRPEWNEFGTLNFGTNTAKFFQEELELKFFNFYLKDKGQWNAAEATMFNTSTNEWKTFETWPPKDSEKKELHFQANGKLSWNETTEKDGFDEYVSDPAKPVPYTDGIFARRNNQYMVEDQRFASRRPDVITYETELLTEDVTLAGPMTAHFFASTTGTDADFIVKLIDVLPDEAPNPSPNPKNLTMAGYQRLVRAEVLRGKFRNSFEKPEPFVPNQVTDVKVRMPDVLHTFKKGHKIMVQIQSSWFPLVDRNPQKFMSIPEADEKDFQKATIRIYHSTQHDSHLHVGTLK